MAHIKIAPIKSHAGVGEQLRYAMDLRKTRMPGFEELPEETGPALIPRYVSGIGVSAPQFAAAEFRGTQRMWADPKGNAAYHVIQSFHPQDRADADLVHSLGRQLVQRACPGHEAVVATHLNRPHLHNHLIVNSVRAADGRKLAPEPGHGLHSFSLLNYLYFRSDELCTENGLQTMSGRRTICPGHWRERTFSPNTWRSAVNADIRAAAARAGSVGETLQLLCAIGYTVREENGKTCIRQPGGKHLWRLDSFYLPWELEVMTEDGAMRAYMEERAKARCRMRFHPKGNVPAHERAGDLEAAGLLWLAVLGTKDRFRFPEIPMQAFVYARRDAQAFRLLRDAGVRTFRQAEYLGRRAARRGRRGKAAAGSQAETESAKKERDRAGALRAAARRALGWKQKLDLADGKEGRRRNRKQDIYER